MYDVFVGNGFIRSERLVDLRSRLNGIFLKSVFDVLPFNQPNSKQSRFGMHECIPYESVVPFSIQLTSFIE